MPTVTATSYRIPTEVKESAEAAAKRLGTNMTFVITQLLKGFAANPQVLLTENGFTTQFETNILAAKQGKYQTHKSGQDFLKSLEKRTNN